MASSHISLSSPSYDQSICSWFVIFYQDGFPYYLLGIRRILLDLLRVCTYSEDFSTMDLESRGVSTMKWRINFFVVNQLSSSIQLLHFLELLQAVLYYFYCPWMGSPSSRGFLSLDGKKYPLVSLGDQRNRTNSFRTGLSTINHLMKTLSSSPWENIEHFHTISYMTFSQWFKVRTIICKLYLQNWR